MLGSVSFIVLLLLCILCTFCYSVKTAYGHVEFGKQCQQIIDALNVQASHRISTGDNAEIDADTKTVVSDSKLIAQKFGNVTNEVYPASFDLRNVDLDGQGAKNYVTSVKFQNPWGSCWAFAGIAASETSILSELRQNSYTTDASGNKHDTLDLSEHHLAWFNYSPMQSFETDTQAGEGAYSMSEEKAKSEGEQWWLSKRMGTGGVAMSTNSSFAMGMGVVREPDFYDTSVSPVIRQLLYKGINGTIGQTSRGADIYSAEDDWSIDYSARFIQDYKLEQGLILPNAKGPTDEDYDIENAKRVTLMMKKQLMEGHALNIAFKADQARPDTPPEKLKYLNPETWAHYTWEKVGASHDVTVVGWDDNYSKDNFLPDHKPPYNGAWIVKNSWGAKDSWGQGLNQSEWGVDGKGYFYMSYYDQSLGSEESYDYDVTGTSADAVITNQYDFMPCEKAKAIEQTASVTTANVFKSPVDQDITEIGTMTSTETETATYKLYKLSSADQRIDTGELLWTGSEYYDYKGYHRIRLGQSFHMNQGDVFAVTKTEQSGNKYLMGVASDANRAGYEAGKAGDSYYCKGIVNPGESYLYTSSDDTWTDFSLIKAELESGSGDAQYYTYDNFPIKAYGVPTSSPTPSDPDPGLLYETAATGDNCPLYVVFGLLIFGTFVLFNNRKRVIG